MPISAGSVSRYILQFLRHTHEVDQALSMWSLQYFPSFVIDSFVFCLTRASPSVDIRNVIHEKVPNKERFGNIQKKGTQIKAKRDMIEIF